MQRLTIITRHAADAVTISVAGEIDISTSPDLRAALRTAARAEPPPNQLRVDLRGVPFVDSSGISALISGWKAATANGVRFTVDNAGPLVHKVMSIAGVATMFCDPRPDN